MKSVYIRGNASLYGEVTIQGSKNAALPIMAAALLVPGVCVLRNCPRIADVEYMCRILESIGCRVDREGREIRIDAAQLSDSRLPREYVTRMRSSVMLMGPLLGRLGEVSLSHPGGCVIGDRPIDLHVKTLSRMGAACRDDGTQLSASVSGLRGTSLRLDYPSVGATENVIMAAVTADGVTCLENCAQEPEIGWLCDFLIHCGAQIEKKSPGRLLIRGQTGLHPCTYTIPADRIVAGTYLCACLAAGGEALLKGAPEGENEALERTARRMGAGLERRQDSLLVKRTGPLLSPGEVETGSFPAFPTDLQSPLLVAMAQAEGESSMRETVFNGRFGVVEELNRMGAGIEVQKDTARVPGGRRLAGGRVRAAELRGGAALVIAGLCAQGETLVENRSYVDRGYEDICRDLRLLGACVQDG
ncbi:MAG TPA: UDP-N-acetylglucosamine 1-carboxyvinyltransferase [Candidatus Eisenbergiella merdavium]|uniref:UDP-N-acetylglucosamine 1-carboxyvinyltransferase n=1 Tax=Candidatus Eisenbergiella merdavium TaxID=2838551 RepID=A0A9D2NGZ1_9FIRM|nr:UDP-N-acetylglucosamine 1-carboxyvinyltransferase [Candidatus Eisenbergiella merdavium]